MKKTLLTLSLLLAAAGTAFAQSAPGTVMVVDMQRLFTEYWEVQDAQEKFDASVETARGEVQTMQQSLQADQQALEELQAKTQNPVLSEEAKQAAMEELQTKFEEFQGKQREMQQTQQQLDQNLQARRQQIFNNFNEKIVGVVEQHAQDNGIDLVLNKVGSSVIFAADKFDGTDAVLDILNQDAPAE